MYLKLGVVWFVLAVCHAACLCAQAQVPQAAQADSQTTKPRTKKVGLVLSGGGGRGLAHIGVIRALEEYNIPIDYITGTSMGAMVGAFYASGYSPDEMSYIAWRSGQQWLAPGPVVAEEYYFNRERVDGTFLNVPLAMRHNRRVLPEYLFSDYAVNIGLVERLYGPSGRAVNNFDSLMIPFRAVASDVYNRKAVVLRNGSLAFAVRSSMSVPLFFLPTHNKEYKELVDGGVINNFPSDVMQEEFKPDYIIGVFVNEPPPRQEDYLKQGGLLYKVFSPTINQLTYQKLPPNGMFIQPDLGDLSSTDFSVEAVNKAIELGYKATVACIKDIQANIGMRQTAEELAEKRAAFKQNWPPLTISSIEVVGLRPQETRYVRRIMRLREGTHRFEDLERAYYRLKTDGNYISILPELIYQPGLKAYKLNLNMAPAARFAFRVGGAFFTPSDHSLSLGAQYSNISLLGYNASINLMRGSFMNMASAVGRIDLFGFLPAYIEGEVRAVQWELQRGVIGLLPFDKSARVYHNNIELITSTGFRLRGTGRLAVGATWQQLRDDYFRAPTTTLTDSALTNTVFTGTSHFIRFENSTMDQKMYPEKGQYFYFSLRYNQGFEDYYPLGERAQQQTKYHQWLQARFRVQSLIRTVRFARLGLSFDAAISSLDPFLSDKGTLLSSPRFLPLQDSPILFQPRLYSKFYVAPGLQLVFKLTRNLSFRAEGYYMQRFSQLPIGPNYRQFRIDLADKVVVGTAGMYYRTLVGPVGLFVNYYEDVNPWKVMLHLGFMIFNRHPWD